MPDIVIGLLVFTCACGIVSNIDAERRRRQAVAKTGAALRLADMQQTIARSLSEELLQLRPIAKRREMEAQAYRTLLTQCGLAVDVTWSTPAAGEMPRLQVTAINTRTGAGMTH